MMIVKLDLAKWLVAEGLFSHYWQAAWAIYKDKIVVNQRPLTCLNAEVDLVFPCYIKIKGRSPVIIKDPCFVIDGSNKVKY